MACMHARMHVFARSLKPFCIKKVQLLQFFALQSHKTRIQPSVYGKHALLECLLDAYVHVKFVTYENIHTWRTPMCRAKNLSHRCYRFEERTVVVTSFACMCSVCICMCTCMYVCMHVRFDCTHEHQCVITCTNILHTHSQSLNHANIVRLLHHQNTSKFFIMVLEYCAGGDLAQAIRRRKGQPVSEGVARYLIKQLADGLRAMRELNWVHRDLKPGNLLLSSNNIEDATLKIGDFGFARDLAPESLAETWVGSPLYMAPEILSRESGGYDAKADLWSVGCILFELVMGKQPYGSRAGSHLELMDDIRADKKYVPEAPIHLSDPCGELLDRLLQRLPAQRISYDDFFNHEWFHSGKKTDGSGGNGKNTLHASISGDGKAVNTMISQIMSTNVPPPIPVQAPASHASSSVRTTPVHAASTPSTFNKTVSEQASMSSPQYKSGASQASSPSTPRQYISFQQQDLPQTQNLSSQTSSQPRDMSEQHRAQEYAHNSFYASNAATPQQVHAHVLAAQQPEAGGSPIDACMPGERSTNSGDDYEIIDHGSTTHEAVIVDSDRDRDLDRQTDLYSLHAGGDRRKPSVFAMIATLPLEVANVARNTENLISDVVVCTREVVELANDKLREKPALASQALVLYLWSLRLLHRALSHLHELQNSLGGLLPAKLVSTWQLTLRSHLNDDFCKAKLAMRMSVETSLNTDAPWINTLGQVNHKALNQAVAPSAERIAYATALNCARSAAANEMLFGLPWIEAKAMYRRALLLMCSLLLEENSPMEERKSLVSFAKMFASRLVFVPDRGQGGLHDNLHELLTVAERCCRSSRLNSSTPLATSLRPLGI
jgi:serine/threonine protein kinase